MSDMRKEENSNRKEAYAYIVIYIRKKIRLEMSEENVI